MSALFPNYWIISVPGGDSKSQAYQRFDSLTGKDTGLSVNSKFDIPDLKVGTLDSLMQISDELVKNDLYAETTLFKLAANLANLLDKDQKTFESSLMVNGMPLRNYLQQFQWNEAKFPTKNSVKDLVDLTMKLVSEIENEMKVKMAGYSNMKTNLANIERKQTGNLLVRNLSDIVDKDHFVLDSEYITTLLVVVSRHSVKDWLACYEKDLCDMVVPRSAEKVSEDKDYALYTVTLFKKFVDDFKIKAREKKFIVRDFEYNADDIAAEREQRNQMGTDLKKQLANITRWLKTNFSEIFEAWVHLKALRVFVESVLRYGLPPNFQAIMLQPNFKNEKKLRHVLSHNYSTGGDKFKGHKDDEMSSHHGFHGEYYPYVWFALNLEPIK